MEHLTKFKGAMLGIAVIAVADLLAKTAKGVVSLVQNLLPSPTPKEGVQPVQKASRLGAIFPTAGIGTIYGLLLAGLLFALLLLHLAAEAKKHKKKTNSTLMPSSRSAT